MITGIGMRQLLCSIIFLTLCLTPVSSRLSYAADGSRHVPTIDELLTIKAAGGAQISPDGHWVAYTVTNADFKQDAFVTQIWLAETGNKGRTLQLTRGEKSSTNPRWSPDGEWLAFTSNRFEDKNQIFVINPAGG
jgi:dipeptidyl aminopeptidase/acylaminoacyl peptidase